MVGNSMAAALASLEHTNLRVALVDQQPAPAPIEPSKEFSNRVISLSAGSVDFLRRTGVWDFMEPSRICPYEKIKVWDDEDGSLSFDSSQRQMAYIVENNNLVHAGYKAAVSRKNVNFYHSCRIKQLQLPRVTSQDLDGPLTWTTKSGFAEMELDCGTNIKARLVIGADGANSGVRKAAEISTHGWSYNQRGLVATLVHDDMGQRQTAFQKFSSLGITAMLPLSSTRTSLVWSCSPEVAQKLQNIDGNDFCLLLNAALRLPAIETEYLLSQTNSKGESLINFDEELAWRYEKMSMNDHMSDIPFVSDVIPGSRASFPLRFQKATGFCDHRVALIGDAAHVVHPMAGQGVNIGFSDCDHLFENIKSTLSVGQDIGSYTVLKDYGTNSELRTLPMMISIDALWNIFHATNSFPFNLARSAGMSIFDKFPAIKVFTLSIYMSVF